MALDIKPGNIVAVLSGKAKATTSEAWSRALDTVWPQQQAVLRAQKGFIDCKALWNIENNQEILVLAYWNSLVERLAYEKSAAARPRALMETTLQGPPPRPKFEVLQSRGAGLDRIKEGHIVAIMSAKSRAPTRDEYAREIARIWDKATRPLETQKGFLSAQVLYNIEGTRLAHVMGFWATLEQRLAYEGSISRQVRGPFESITESPYPRPKYVVVKSM
ncbi:MAG: hypothetical protein Q7T26_04835 [Dehalococcoidia bacterium]|nr:hypothetical protein [Dehalococcoidia bacterium]